MPSHVSAVFLTLWLVHRQEAGEDWELTSTGVTTETGLGSVAVTKGLRVLRDEGYVIRAATPRDKGRPSYSYGGTKKMSRLIELIRTSFFANEHLQRVQLILTQEFAKDTGYNGRMMRCSDRVLLMALLGQADVNGVLRDVGYSDLAKISALTKKQVRLGVGRLLNRGLLNRHVSGLRDTFLLGLSASSYFLNTKHPAYRAHKASSITILWKTNSQEIWQARMVISSLVKIYQKELVDDEVAAPTKKDVYKHIRSTLKESIFIHTSPPDEQLRHFVETLVKLFPEKMSRKFLQRRIMYLQAEVERYASTLLSNRSVALRHALPLLREEVLGEIEENLMMRRKIKKEERITPHLKSIAFFLYIVAYEIGMRLEGELGGRSGFSGRLFKNGVISIIPQACSEEDQDQSSQDKRPVYIALEASSTDPRIKRDGYYDANAHSVIDDLPLETMLLYGVAQGGKGAIQGHDKPNTE